MAIKNARKTRKTSRKTSRKGSKKKAVPLAQGHLLDTAISMSGVTTTSACARVGDIASQMNSRLYRQGMVYDVAFSLANPRSLVSRQYNFYTLPNNWFVLGAIKYAFAQYRAGLQDELIQTGGKTSKWHDFRMSTTDPDGTQSTMYPCMWDGDSWETITTGMPSLTSVITAAGGTEKGFIIGGEVSNYYNILLEYGRHLMSRRADDSSESGPQAYEGLQTGAADLDRLLEDGETPPYDEDFAMWHNGGDADTDTRLIHQDTLYIGTVDSDDTSSRAPDSRFRTRTFKAPLGFVYVEASANLASGTSNPDLCLHLKPGNYKGVSAQPIYRWDLLGATAKSLR